MLILTNDQDLILQDKLTILYFYASWMPFHKKMHSMLLKMEEKYDFQFVAIDIDYFKSFLTRFKITSIPTVIGVYNGKELNRITGVILTSVLKAFCVKIKDEYEKRRKKS
jgi:thioredoxin-like negative regulator of GroEL